MATWTVNSVCSHTRHLNCVNEGFAKRCIENDLIGGPQREQNWLVQNVGRRSMQDVFRKRTGQCTEYQTSTPHPDGTTQPLH
jgi:hypothetical protein